MTKKEIIIEYNKLIAKFMGVWVEDVFFACEFANSDSYDSMSPEELKYHSSWDWLIPAISKYNNKYNINLMHSRHCFDIFNLYKSLGSQLTLRKNHELQN